MKRGWLFWLLAIAFLWIVASRFTEIAKLTTTLAQGQWQWVLVAALLQVLYYLVFAAVYQSAFSAVQVSSRIRDLVYLVLASVFVNTAAPTGGASGAALFVDDATRRGQSAARATAGTLLVTVADLGTFVLVMIAGLAHLLVVHDLQTYEVVAAVALLALVGGLGSVLSLGLWAPHRLQDVLGWIQQTVNRLATRLRRPALLPEKWAEANAREFAEAAAAIAKHPGRLARILAIALAAHLVDLVSLYVLFLAFHEPVSLGVLVTGYAVGVLFWIVSITPQGIGVVEGVMALVYASLGVPAAQSTVIVLAYRGLTFWLPLLIGFVLLRRVQTFARAGHARTGAFGVRAVAVVTALAGIVNVLSAVLPALGDRLAILRRILPLVLRQGARLATVLSGFGLLLLAGTLWRRKRVAWLLALILLCISIVSHLLKGLDYEEATLEGALVIWLLFLHRRFRARSDLPSVRQGVRVLIAALVFVLSYGTAGFYLLDRHFQVNFGLGAALRQTIAMFVQFNDPGLEPVTGFGRYFASSIYVVGAVTTGYALLMLLRPVLMRGPAAEAERSQAASIVQAYGRSSLARFTLFDDKSYYWSLGGSLVAYVAKGRFAVTLGDPIGPAEDAAAAISGFQEHCARNDWLPVFYQTLPDYLDQYRAAGFEVLCIGHEAIVDLSTFTLAGGANKSLRAAVNRLTKEGYQAELHEPPLSDDLLHALRSISDEWLQEIHGAEKHFSLGRFDEAYLRSGPVMVVLEPGGRISAFANILSEYQLNESTIDLMRHRRDVESGTMDFLFVSLFEWAKTQGYATFNLGLSSLAGVGEQSGDPLVERVLHYVYEHVNQFYNFKGLHQFKVKFHPHWSPRYLVYPNVASLPGAVAALVRADSGDDFARAYLSDLIESWREGREQGEAADRIGSVTGYGSGT
jgi:phosphatidylglycerol lysyltransferase